MSEMSFAPRTQEFDTLHAMAGIRPLQDMGFIELGMEARPATTGIELACGIEQRVAATHAMIPAPLPVILECTAERPFGTCLAGYAILFPRQLPAPFFVGFADLHISCRVFQKAAWPEL